MEHYFIGIDLGDGPVSSVEPETWANIDAAEFIDHVAERYAAAGIHIADNIDLVSFACGAPVFEITPARLDRSAVVVPKTAEILRNGLDSLL